MALSDWATVAFDHKGQPGVGWIKNPRGTVLRIYKNWVYLSNKKMWTPGMDYINPTIAQINEGDLTIGGFEIHAARGLQNSIFVVGSYRYGRGFNRRYFGGVAGNPWRDTVAEVLKEAGIVDDGEDIWCDVSELDPDGDEIRSVVSARTQKSIVYHREREHGKYDMSKDYRGILPRTFQEFCIWAGHLDMMYYDKKYQEWYKNVTNAEPQCYNQGDAFFSGRLGHDIPATPIGEKQSLPLLIQVLS